MNLRVHFQATTVVEVWDWRSSFVHHVIMIYLYMLMLKLCHFDQQYIHYSPGTPFTNNGKSIIKAMTWISSYISGLMRDVITNPCHNTNEGLTKVRQKSKAEMSNDVLHKHWV